MGYIESFKNDIFISYSHIDSEKSAGQTISWIEQFYKDLNVALWQSIGTKDITIWWDNKRLDGGILFDDAIEKSINDSAIFLCLNSPSFLHSEYCQKELDLFYKKAQKDKYGLKVKDRTRIINVLLYNIAYTKWPFELNGTTGFRFHNAEDDNDYGDPVDFTAAEYKKELHDLRDALVALIETLRTPPVVVEKEFTIYFGDVSDSLRSLKNKTVAALKEEGFKVLPDVPPPYEEDEHESAVKEVLSTTTLAVHLLDEYPGREIMGAESTWYPKKQTELSLLSDKSKLIWVPSQVSISDIEDDAYKQFITDLDSGKHTATNMDFIRGVKGELITQVKDMAARIIKETAPPPLNEKVSVLLNTHIKDVMYALELSNTLSDKEIKTYINSQEDDPAKKTHILEERISQVSKLIFFYGSVTKDWVIERMNAALQLIVANNYAIDNFFIFMLPPHKEANEFALKQRFLKVNVFNYSDQSEITAPALDEFFNNLRS